MPPDRAGNGPEPANRDADLLCPADRRVHPASSQKRAEHGMHRHDHHGRLGSLHAVAGHGIGQQQIVSASRHDAGSFRIEKPHDHLLLVDKLDHPAHVSVDHLDQILNSGRLAVAVLDRGVLDLNHLVADAPGPQFFQILRRRSRIRIQASLQHRVQSVAGQRGPAVHGADHLNVPDGIVSALGHPFGDDLAHDLRDPLRAVDLDVPQVLAGFRIQFVARVIDAAHGDLVACPDNLSAVSMNLGQPGVRNRAGCQDVPQHGAGPHGRQLALVSDDQDAGAAVHDGPQQAGHEVRCHHGYLVDNQQVDVQGIVLVERKNKLAVIHHAAQQAVNGRSLAPGGLSHALGRLAGRRRHGHGHALAVCPVAHLVNGHGLPGSWASGEHADLVALDHLDGRQLFVRQLYHLCSFLLIDWLVCFDLLDPVPAMPAIIDRPHAVLAELARKAEMLAFLWLEPVRLVVGGP